MASRKCRSWWWVQLLDNLPRTWESDFKALCISSCYIVHDKDYKAHTGELVKPHVHVLMEYPNAVRSSTVLGVLPETFNVLHAEPVSSKAGAYRYMLHIGEDNKHEYSVEEMHHLHGFNVNLSQAFGVSFKDLYKLIHEQQIKCFSALVAYCVEVDSRYLDYVLGHNVLLRGYFNDLNINTCDNIYYRVIRFI